MRKIHFLRHLNQPSLAVKFHQRRFAVLFRQLFCFWNISMASFSEEVSTVFVMTSRGINVFPRKSQRKTESWKSFRELELLGNWFKYHIITNIIKTSLASNSVIDPTWNFRDTLILQISRFTKNREIKVTQTISVANLTHYVTVDI